MAKFKSPTGNNEIWISQTTHGESATNPNDLSKQKAIDISMSGGTNFVSVCSGTVELTTTLGGGYVSVIPDNASFRILYVHTKDWVVSKGQRVQVGQILGKIQTLSTGSHLHFGLKNISGVAPHPEPMDYFDRSIVFRTKYQAIKDLWFTGENINWALFKDLNYDNTAMSFKKGDVLEFTGEQNIRKGSGTSYEVVRASKVGEIFTVADNPRIADNYTWYDTGNGWAADVGKFKVYVKPEEPQNPPQQTECEKQINILQIQIKSLESKLGTQEIQLKALEGEKVKLLEKIKEVEKESKENFELYDIEVGRNKILEQEKLDLEEELSKCKIQLEEGQINFIKKILEAIGKWLGSIKG
jgi:hypothetical protein